MAERRNWSESEVRHALALYLLTDFGRIHSGNPDIISLASQIGRSANAVALKLANLAALDTSLPQKGMAHASATDRRVWDEFLYDPSGVLDAHSQQSQPSLQLGLAEAPAEFIHQVAGERRVETTQRIGQDFFRKMILTSYRQRCALTGIEDIRLLNASHIAAWKEDVENRLNPANGICLNALHDRAFDRHLITFDEDYAMKIAPHVPEVARRELERVDSSRLELPVRFLPDQALLEKHRRTFFEKSREAI